jgi:capsular polysaccharide biosynthesis protein
MPTPKKKNRRLPLPLPGFFFWQPKSCCSSLRQWHPDHPAELARNGVLKFTELTPATGCSGYVAELRDAKVIGDVRLVATAADVVLGDLQFLHSAENPTQHWVLEQVRFRLPQSLAGPALLLAASSGDNYYHWLFDSLPRLHLWELAGGSPKDIKHFLLKRDALPFQSQTLDILGIPAARRHRCAKRGILRLDRLFVPSMPGPAMNPPPWICHFLREKFLPAAAAAPARKIFISRRFTQGRKIINEAEILPQLARHGYETVFPENLTFRAQVELFASAKKIIALHGAGLANLVFTPPGARVLELCSPVHSNTLYQTVSAHGGLHHDQLQLAAAKVSEKDRRLANLVVDPGIFRRKLEQFD